MCTENDSKKLNSGDVLYLGRAASVQFSKPIMFKVIRILNWTTYFGWVWLEGYQLNHKGDAVEKRLLFVRISGLKNVLDQRLP